MSSPNPTFLTMMPRLFVCFACVLLSACRTGQELSLVARRLTTREMIERSALVVAGKIVDVRISGRVHRTSQGIWVKLWRVVVDPEYWLKGHLNGPFVYYLYNYSNDVVQNGDFEWVAKGDHRLLFLTYERETIRAVADLYTTSFELHRSNIPDLRAYNDSPLGEKIARLLLTPTPGKPASRFASTIPEVTPEALRATGYPFVASLLAQLSRSESPDVRTEACLTSYEQLFGDRECVGQVEPSVSADLAQRILRDYKRREYLRTLIADAIRSGARSPLLNYYTTGVEHNDPRSVLDFFRFLSANRDPLFRLTAEKELRALSPRRSNGPS